MIKLNIINQSKIYKRNLRIIRLIINNKLLKKICEWLY